MLARFFVAVFACIAFSGCLTSEFKEVRITLNSDGRSGKGSIVFSDISSERGDDTTAVTNEDFNSLITEYYQGKTFETANAGLSNIKKRLYVQNGKLMGEITFDFADLAAIGFYRHASEGPFMYYTLVDGYFTSGELASTNGSYGGEKMPVIFWQAKTSEFYWKMKLSQAPRVSLASQYESWEKRR